MQKRFPAIWKPVGVTQVSTYTKKVTLLDLGRSRRPDTASQLRLAPPKRLTMEEEEEKDSDEAGAMFLSTVWCPFLEEKKTIVVKHS